MRRKRTETKQNNTEKEEFVYCGLRHCPHIHCLRHNKNTPFNVIVLRRNFSPDKKWNCKDIVEV